MKKIATKMALMAMTAGLGFSIPTAAAGASMTSYSYDFSAATSLPGGPFAGSFTVQVASGVWSLTAFSGSLNGYTYDLGNVGLDSNRNPSLLYIGGKAAGAMLVRNIETVTHDPMLSREYAGLEQVPPTALRVPVKLTTIATVLSAPRVTVWRHVRSMIAAGIVAETPEGYLVSPTWLASAATIESAKAIADYMLRSLHTLAARLAPDDGSAR